MALPVAPLLARLSANALNDADNEVWPLDDLRAYLSEAQRAAVLLRPEVNPVTEAIQAVPGTRQSIPADSYVLLDVTRNLGPAGTTPRRVITPSSRSALDQTEIDWHMAAPDPDGDVTNWMYDIRNRRTFYLSPPQPDPAHYIEIVTAKTPAQIKTVAEAATATVNDPDILRIDDIYEPALIAYLLHRAFVKDVAHEAAGGGRTSQYFEWFVTMITGNADQKDVELVLRQDVRETG